MASRYRAVRKHLGLSQRDIARFAGVSPAAIATYEAGRRRPTGRAATVMDNMLAAFDGPIFLAEDGRGRPIDLPAERWRHVVPRDTIVRLPVKLDWSPSVEPKRNLSDRRVRASAYAQVIEEGTSADIRFWIDPDALVELWPDVPLARRMRPHIDRLVDRLQSQSEEESCGGSL